MAWGFLKNLVGVKADQVVQTGIQAYVRWDPVGASEAEIRSMDENLDKLGLNVATARAKYTEAQKALDTANALLHQRLTAADTLQAQIAAAAEGSTARTSLEASLSKLLSLVEASMPEIEQGKADAEDAGAFLHELENTYQLLGGKLKTARSDLERAQREMERAGQAKDAAAERAAIAAQAAGIRAAPSSVNIALGAMHDAANKDRLAAEALNAKSRLLAPTHPETDDPNIAAALAGAAGAPVVPLTASERLAALRERVSA